MRCVAFTSKVYSLVLTVPVVALGLAFALLGGDRVPMIVRVLGVGLAVLSLVSCLIGLGSNKVVIEIDEDGLFCKSLGMTKIPWDRIVSVEQLPRVRKIRQGGRVVTQFDLSENWRKVVISVRDPESMMGGLVKGAFQVTNALPRRGAVTYAPDEANPGCYKFLIEPMGTTAKSGEMLACITDYLALKKG